MSGCGYSPAMWSKHRIDSFDKIIQPFKPTVRPLSALRQCTPLWAPPPPPPPAKDLTRRIL